MMHKKVLHFPPVSGSIRQIPHKAPERSRPMHGSVEKPDENAGNFLGNAGGPFSSRRIYRAGIS